jgi:hypothetical protein
MLLAIHQPEHMPWPGFFHKMAIADNYVFLDDVQFRKNYFQNRNKLVNADGDEFWLTTPLKSGSIDQKINEKVLAEFQWKNDYLNKIRNAYSSSKFYKRYYPELVDIVNSDYQLLVDFNIALIEWFRCNLDIRTPFCFSSDLTYSGEKSDLILDICNLKNANKYLSGPSGRDYLDMLKFKNRGIEVLFHDFQPPVYNSNSYRPGLSTLDILMSHGPETLYIIFEAQIKGH